ncbi:MAG: hypothetical protein HY866_07425 [Chloroflexi bacterium]|nr:hypothetical protein [Chloroflexota bacterium]
MKRYGIAVVVCLLMAAVLYLLYIGVVSEPSDKSSEQRSIPTRQPDEPASPKAQALRDMLTSCDHACFEGIELDTSTKTDVMGIFNTLGIEPVIDDYGDSAIWWWEPKDGQSFAINEIHPKGGFITFHGEIVRQVAVTLDVDLTTVIEAFGSPDAVIEQLITNGTGIVVYNLVYADKRLVFSTDSRYMIENVVLVSAFKDNQLDILLAGNSSQPCVDYGTPPCLVPTATPRSAP